MGGRATVLSLPLDLRQLALREAPMAVLSAGVPCYRIYAIGSGSAWPVQWTRSTRRGPPAQRKPGSHGGPFLRVRQHPAQGKPRARHTVHFRACARAPSCVRARLRAAGAASRWCTRARAVCRVPRGARTAPTRAAAAPSPAGPPPCPCACALGELAHARQRTLIRGRTPCPLVLVRQRRGGLGDLRGAGRTGRSPAPAPR